MGHARINTGGLVFLLAVLVCFPTAAHAQSPSARRLEVGGFVGAIDFREVIGEKPFAIGLRFGYRMTDRLVVEAEVNSCPETSGNFGQLLLTAGPRLGVSFGPLTVAGKVRAGAIHFRGRAFRAHNPDMAVKAVLNAGLVVELAYSPTVALRIDAGDVIVPFGSSQVRGPLPPYSAQYGTTHNVEGTFGVVVRF